MYVLKLFVSMYRYIYMSMCVYLYMCIPKHEKDMDIEIDLDMDMDMTTGMDTDICTRKLRIEKTFYFFYEQKRHFVRNHQS